MTLVKLLTQKSDVDEIILHLQGYRGEYELSAALDEKLKLLSHTRDLIQQYANRSKVTKMLVNEKGLSKSAADKIYLDTLYVFNTTQTSNRDFWIDVALGMAKDDHRRAVQDGDHKGASAATANFVRLIALMTDDKLSELYKRLNVAPRIIEFNPALTGVTLPENWRAIADNLIKNAKSRDVSGIDEAKVQEEPDDE